MRSLLALTLLVALPTFANEVPLRPLTYSQDPKLSPAPLANFFKLYVEPQAFLAGLKPKTPAASGSAPQGTLLVHNDRLAQAEVAVGGVKVGVIGPATIGNIGPVPSGTYAVTLTWINGLALTSEVATTNEPAPAAYGGPADAPK